MYYKRKPSSQTYLKTTDDQQPLNVELLDTSGDVSLLVAGQSSLRAEESATLTDPTSHIRPDMI